MVSVVTGGAGYIGGHLVDALLQQGNQVLVLDDLSSGNYINSMAKFQRIDLRSQSPKLESCDTMYHLAANPDVRTSMENIEEHFERDVKATLNALESARKSDCKFFIFFSSSTVYGEAKTPTPETAETNPISNYGLFKLMGEEMTRFYSQNYGITALSLRLANITGGRVSHGVVIDFIKKLMKDPTTLEILGNGKQRKSYLHVSDLIQAVLFLKDRHRRGYDYFNVGNEDWITVDEIASIVEEEMGLRPVHVYRDADNGRGWKGDVRLMLLDISKIKSLGWAPTLSSREVIRRATREALRLLGYEKV
ncbi:MULTISPECIES: NAD-dependent epimerase/dehydratase family protein [Metallosphaera]|uniref:NAD-dependent epimerase/dehydratase n=3 Tax=Metallosphaera TaxID=41980 RepID=A4YD49_METS5|nr:MULTISPECIES: NAD-dependent epimerase/dehydratase family protein [Metallosphaera]ABP94351.1 NAD-dependent epimerase/dehydratase [Metallosphaera sedula DSM 5348]AIM26338.1 NAD-dependent epimerase/dehydratase [Metallosphaera sedula]AKV73346.1 NAD-dependent dehydratase [Metallosphaera sedula]AKV75590.1 NAD-dependent dehydratase [Metallosphaera sedula]AKV77836.1 NAD-dependent dehydratase [Metallosphaera sedula]